MSLLSSTIDTPQDTEPTEIHYICLTSYGNLRLEVLCHCLRMFNSPLNAFGIHTYIHTYGQFGFIGIHSRMCPFLGHTSQHIIASNMGYFYIDRMKYDKYISVCQCLLTFCKVLADFKFE